MDSHALRQELASPHITSPITRLPFELLRSVVLLCTSSGDTRQTLRLLHVSSTWRAVTLDCPRLFTEPDWNRSSSDMLRAWSSWAQNAPLTVRLGPQAMNRLAAAFCLDHGSGSLRKSSNGDEGESWSVGEESRQDPDAFKYILGSTCSSWSFAMLDCGPQCEIKNDVHEAMSHFIFAHDFPILRHLNYARCYSTEQLSFRLDAPKIQKLELFYTVPRFVTPVEELNSAAVSLARPWRNEPLPIFPWTAWMGDIPSASTLKQLKILYLGPTNLFSTTDAITIPALKFLYITEGESPADYTLLLKSVNLVNLTSVSFGTWKLAPQSWKEFTRALVRGFHP